MINRNKEQTLGEMLNSPEAPKTPEAIEKMSMEEWDKKAQARAEWAATQAKNVTEGVQKLWKGLKSRIKSVPDAIYSHANIDYDRNTKADGGTLENLGASLGDITEKIGKKFEGGKDRLKKSYKLFKEYYNDLPKAVDKGEDIVEAKLAAGLSYVDNRIADQYDRFVSFLNYHSPNQRKARAREATKAQVESLQTERAVTNMSAEDLMNLLNNSDKLGVNVTGIKVEVGSMVEPFERKQPESELAKAA